MPTRDASGTSRSEADRPFVAMSNGIASTGGGEHDGGTDLRSRQICERKSNRTTAPAAGAPTPRALRANPILGEHGLAEEHRFGESSSRTGSNRLTCHFSSRMASTVRIIAAGFASKFSRFGGRGRRPDGRQREEAEGTRDQPAITA
jgi:hypothetical protein